MLTVMEVIMFTENSAYSWPTESSWERGRKGIGSFIGNKFKRKDSGSGMLLGIMGRRCVWRLCHIHFIHKLLAQYKINNDYTLVCCQSFLYYLKDNI